MHSLTGPSLPGGRNNRHFLTYLVKLVATQFNGPLNKL